MGRKRDLKEIDDGTGEHLGFSKASVMVVYSISFIYSRQSVSLGMWFTPVVFITFHRIEEVFSR